MKHLITFLTSAALLLALAGCMDVGTGGGSASPAKNSAASASASAQVKALCDSSVAKSKAGDVVGAQADINQAIANVAQIRIGGYYSENFIILADDNEVFLKPTPENYQFRDEMKIIRADIYAGNIDEAKRLLDNSRLRPKNSGDFYNYSLYFARLEAYIIIGDFTRARECMQYLEREQSERLIKVAIYRALIGDKAQANKDIACVLTAARGMTAIRFIQPLYCMIAEGQIYIGDFSDAKLSLDYAKSAMSSSGNQDPDREKELTSAMQDLAHFQSNPTLCWGNPANPRRVAMTQVSKARCELALAQAKAGDIGAAKATLYFIIDEPDKIATEQAIAQAGAAFLQSGNVAKGIETLVVIPSAKQATAAQIRETIKTWLDIKNAKLAEMLAKLSPQEKEALKTKLELAILDCVTQADQAKTMSIMAAQGGQGDALALSELSNNYLNLQNVLKAVYKSLSEE